LGFGGEEKEEDLAVKLFVNLQDIKNIYEKFMKSPMEIEMAEGNIVSLSVKSVFKKLTAQKTRMFPNSSLAFCLLLLLHLSFFAFFYYSFSTKSSYCSLSSSSSSPCSSSFSSFYNYRFICLLFLAEKFINTIFFSFPLFIDSFTFFQALIVLFVATPVEDVCHYNNHHHHHHHYHHH
jgi:hypothetical protein